MITLVNGREQALPRQTHCITWRMIPLMAYDLALVLDGFVSMLQATGTTASNMLLHLTDDPVDGIRFATGLGRNLLNAALEASVPGCHRPDLLSLEQPLQVGHNVPGTVVGDGGGPTRADALCSVHKHHRQDGHIPAAPHPY